MTEIPNLREIRRTPLTLDGKSKSEELAIGCPDHMFIVLTKREYNRISKSFLGVPITSEKDTGYDYFRSNFGIDINESDIDGELYLYKKSVILCDRPCRINKSDLQVEYHDSKINQKKYEEIIKNIIRFITEGKVNDDINI